MAGADELKVVESVDDRDAVLSQDGKDGRRNLVANVVEVSNVRFFFPEEGIQFPSRVQGINQAQAEPGSPRKGDVFAIVVNFLDEEGRLRTGFVAGVQGGKNQHGVALAGEEALQLEKERFCPPHRKIEFVDQKNSQRSVLPYLPTLLAIGARLFPKCESVESTVHGH
jgi:hypothetical protein